MGPYDLSLFIYFSFCNVFIVIALFLQLSVSATILLLMLVHYLVKLARDID